ncbi:MAG: hypothetical protein CTY31_05040 [Hyphomicrobium sp.]|nr:MAG: hypothetical protein CTY31_05040 [Hyphomicrobium sp.]
MLIVASMQGMGATMVRTVFVLATAFAVAGCAGRAPDLVPLVQVTDQQLTCEQIVAEAKINNERITQLAREEGWKVTQNVAAGVVGLVIWPVWFGMDFQDAAGKEGKALSQRNEYLGTLAQQRCAPPTTTASIPDKRDNR